MEDFTEKFIELLLISSAVVAIFVYPIALIAIILMIIPFYSYKVMKTEEKLAHNCAKMSKEKMMPLKHA